MSSDRDWNGKSLGYKHKMTPSLSNIAEAPTFASEFKKEKQSDVTDLD